MPVAPSGDIVSVNCIYFFRIIEKERTAQTVTQTKIRDSWKSIDV